MYWDFIIQVLAFEIHHFEERLWLYVSVKLLSDKDSTWRQIQYLL